MASVVTQGESFIVYREIVIYFISLLDVHTNFGFCSMSEIVGDVFSSEYVGSVFYYVLCLLFVF